jgi:AcrR family transcriptional regulator
MSSAAHTRPLPDGRLARATIEPDTRATLLAAAARVLSEEGPAALTVRRVAEAVNAVAKMAYSRPSTCTASPV